jgi:hypothetical protein
MVEYYAGRNILRFPDSLAARKEWLNRVFKRLSGLPELSGRKYSDYPVVLEFVVITGLNFFRINFGHRSRFNN